jgi:putative spermidine/putrescine transport system substrate-binding protein
MQVRQQRVGKLSRRAALAGSLAALSMPFVWRRAHAARQVRMRTSGRNVEDVMRPVVWDPFTKETGIEVINIPATSSKMLASIRAGQPEVDVANSSVEILILADRAGGLLPIDYDKFKFSNVADIDPIYRRSSTCAIYQYGTVMVYNTESFPRPELVPQSWADFWDLKKFPGKRTLPDMSSGRPALEFALLADGVGRDKLFPLDIDRSLKSLSRIRPEVVKFWNTSALANQMLIDKEAVLGGAWNGPLMTAIRKGAPLGLQWNDHMVSLQSLGITKGALDVEAARMLIDFSATPECQAGMAKGFGYGPINNKAFALLPPESLDWTVGSPKLRDKGFLQDEEWWTENTAEVSQRWSKWILG